MNQLSAFQIEMLRRFDGTRFKVPSGLQTRSCAGLFARNLMDREEAWREQGGDRVTWEYRTNDAGRRVTEATA